MKRFSTLAACAFAVLLLAAADGCSSDPNVEGAKLDLRNKDYGRAIENVNKALEKDPNNADALELKGRILMAQADEVTDPAQHSQLIRDMVDAFNRAAEADPAMAEQVSINLRNAYLQEFDRGVQAYNRGKTNSAEFGTSAEYFGNAALIQPDSSGAYVNRAFALVSASRAPEAMEALEMAVEKGDRQPDTYIYLASLYAENQRAADAVTVLERARDMMPDNPDVQTQLLSAYVAAGQTDRAMDYYREAVQREPGNAVYRYNYGSLLLQSERYEEAVEQLKRASELDAENPNVQYNLGAAYINQAVGVNEEIRVMDDKLREERRTLTNEQIQARENEIDQLVQQRTRLFEAAIPALERAREMAQVSGESPESACRALFQAYTNTRQTEKAQAVSACAGYGDTN